MARYIESIYRRKHIRDRPRARRRGSAAPERVEEPLEGGAYASTLTAVPSVTDYALARRAVLRDFRSGALTRLDVCDAHPELMRAAQNIGVGINDQCPVCGESNLRLVKYVYGDKLKQANGRAISEQRRAGEARRVVRRVRLLRRRGLRRLPVEPPAPPVTARPPARELSRARAPQSSAGSFGYCEQHETHHNSGSGTTVSEPSRSHDAGTT